MTWEQADVGARWAAGRTDREILAICPVTSYRNFIARVADGLGVEQDDFYGELGEAYRQGLNDAKDA